MANNNDPLDANSREDGKAPGFHPDFTYSYPRPSSTPPTTNLNYPYSMPSPSRRDIPAERDEVYSSQYGSLQNYNKELEPAAVNLEKNKSEMQNPFLALPLNPIVVTYGLLAVMIAMFGLSFITDGNTRGLGLGGLSGGFSGKTLVNLGALYSPLIRNNGEWWRLVTVMFLHANLLHILLNGFNFFILGKQLEAVYGAVRFTVIFFLSGISGSVLSFGLHNGNLLGVGASGAIFGLIGALLGFFLLNRNNFGSVGKRSLRSLLLTIGINFAILIAIPGVDNLAHLGGLIGGFILGYLISPAYKFYQASNGFLKIVQTDQRNFKWVFFSLGWAGLVFLAFLFFLNNPLGVTGLKQF